MADKGLTNSNILVSLHMGKPSGIKVKADAAGELADAKGADRGSVKVQVHTFKDEIKPIGDHQQMIRAWFDNRTLPWGDDGKRLVNLSAWEDIRPRLEKYKIENERLYLEFIKQYGEIKERSKARLGSLFDSGDWKSEEELKAKWSVDWDPTAVPDPELDVRAGWGPQQITRMKKDWDAQNKAKGARAQADVLLRMENVLKRFSKLDEYTGGREGSFKDSLVNNTRELVKLLPGFNFNDDPELEEICQRIARELAPINPDDLRDSADLRAKAKASADDLRKRIGDFGNN